MWNKQLAACGHDYKSAVLTIVESSGYPLSVRCKVRFDDALEVVTFAELPEMARRWSGPASVLLHRHNEVLEDFYELLLKGELSAEGGSVTFKPSEFVTGSGRQDTDRMPHAGAPLHLIQFMLLGRRKAREYHAKRGKPWPPIRFDLLVQAAKEIRD